MLVLLHILPFTVQLANWPRKRQVLSQTTGGGQSPEDYRELHLTWPRLHPFPQVPLAMRGIMILGDCCPPLSIWGHFPLLIIECAQAHPLSLTSHVGTTEVQSRKSQHRGSDKRQEGEKLQATLPRGSNICSPRYMPGAPEMGRGMCKVPRFLPVPDPSVAQPGEHRTGVLQSTSAGTQNCDEPILP